MAIRTNCYVTNILRNGDAIAVRCDNDESVYVGVNTVAALELEEMDELDAVIVKSTAANSDAVPWFCRRARLVEDEGDDG